MNDYFKTLNPIIKEYFSVLSKEIPDFLCDYINTKEMQRLSKVGQDCGVYYTKIYCNKFFYSILDHSVGVALVIWHFTKDKKQTLAGLFHDISTPVFKHCIDFLNGDHEKQESTEELTTKLISESKEIMALLERDGIKVEEVDDYKIYPIADNDSPKISSDRLEYNLSGGLYLIEPSFYTEPLWSVNEIRKYYNNLVVVQNENNVPEIAFESIELAEEFIKIASKQWYLWVCNADKLVMQFIADIVKMMIEENYLKADELYYLTEQEVINRIENCENSRISTAFKKFRDIRSINESSTSVQNKYCKSLNSKIRYVNPLVKTDAGVKRIYDVSLIAKEKIDDYLNYKTEKYAYFDFDI
jgi:HD superfamily phosphohydrolase